jgi:hypothetical protein
MNVRADEIKQSDDEITEIMKKVIESIKKECNESFSVYETVKYCKVEAKKKGSLYYVHQQIGDTKYTMVAIFVGEDNIPELILVDPKASKDDELYICYMSCYSLDI